MIEKAVSLCDRVGVFVGSSQESGTAKNPFSYEVREEILRKVFDKKVEIYPLPDIGVGNNSKWGDYVLKNVVERFGEAPDLLVSGKEERRLGWFDDMNGIMVSELYVPKVIDISATKMREFMLDGNLEEWKKYTSESLWSEFDRLSRYVRDSKDELRTDSI